MPAASLAAPTVVEAKGPPSGDVGVLWSSVRAAAAANPSVLVAVSASSLESVSGDLARVRVHEPGKLAYVRGRLGVLEELLGAVVLRRVRIELRGAEGASPVAPLAGAGVDTAAYAQAMGHPLVKRAIDLFNARLIEVGPDDRSSRAEPAAARASEAGPAPGNDDV